MKFIVIGSTKGNVDLVNQHLKKSSADFALCTGDLGLFYRKENFISLPKFFTHNEFPEYIEGRKKFIKPVVCVRGAHDSISLCDKISNREINIDNFHILENGKTIDIEGLSIGGMGGSYSPKYFYKEELKGKEKRHFNSSQVEDLKKTKATVLVMHDLIGNCKKRSIDYSEETYNILDSVHPKYCFIGKYHWWGYSNLPTSNIVILPYADQGYLLVDSDSWKAEGIRFDISIGEN